MLYKLKKHLLLFVNNLHFFVHGLPSKRLVRLYLDSRSNKGKFPGNILSVADTYTNNSEVKDLEDIQIAHKNSLSRERIRQILLKIQKEVKEDLIHGKYKHKL